MPPVLKKVSRPYRITLKYHIKSLHVWKILMLLTTICLMPGKLLHKPLSSSCFLLCKKDLGPKFSDTYHCLWTP